MKEAFLVHYPDTTTESARSAPYRVMAKPAVKEYITLLCGEAADNLIVTKEAVLGALWDIHVRYGDDPKAAGAAAASLKTLLEHLTPKVTKVELTGKDGGPVASKVDGRGASDEMMQRIYEGLLGLTPEQASEMPGGLGKEEVPEEVDGTGVMV